jgi:hypothetical protein
MRINIPANPDDFIKLAKGVYAKHLLLGAASPLNGIEGIATFGAQVGIADTNNTQAGILSGQAETCTETRDNALGAAANTPGSVRFFVTSARDLLLAMNKGTEHKLTDWTFDVLAPAVTPPATPAPPATPHP